jgi:hypothetical protein
MLRSKASDFDYGTIPQLYLQWTKYFKDRPNGVTIRSIMFWAKQYAPEAYEEVKLNTRDHYIEQTFSSPTEFDFALVLAQMYRDKYVCSNLTSKSWYVFKEHRWEQDRGQTLRMALSTEVFKAYQNKIANMMKVTLSSDHRVVDGAVGAKFVQTLKQLLEEPLRLFV